MSDLDDLAGEPLVNVAKAYATVAHRGQVDKAGEPYIDHPRRVAARVSGSVEKAVAWLHDVVEDCGVSASDLHAAGFPVGVRSSVLRLTRVEDVDVDAYYQLIAADPVALAVKLADIADNSDPERLAVLDEVTRARLKRKYERARLALTGGS